jgi:4-cresol dehydrogenase (hydroxylating)
LSAEQLAALGASSDTWHGALALYAPTLAQGRANLRHVRARIAPRVDAFRVEECAGETSGAQLSRADPAARFMLGMPHEQSLRSVYFRKRMTIPEALDPDRDGCGAIWVSAVLPLRGRDVVAAAALAERSMRDHGFDPLLALVAQTDRTIYFLPFIVYDRDEPDADARALACHDTLLAQLVEQGYLPHRLGVQAMQALPRAADDYARFMRTLKRALDPNDILAPGRYDLRNEWDDGQE